MNKVGLIALVSVAVLFTGCSVCCTIECSDCCTACSPACGQDGSSDGIVLSEGEEVDVALDKVPANVMRAAQGAVEGIVIEEAELEVENGVMVYELEGTADGVSYEIEVDLRGKVLEVESETDDDDDEEEHEDGDDDWRILPAPRRAS